jgi:hypothetical protein
VFPPIFGHELGPVVRIVSVEEFMIGHEVGLGF